MEAALELGARVEGSKQGEVAETLAAMTDNQPLLTVIVPTRNEAGNIQPLLARLEEATRGIATRILFVDDSTDDTADVIQAAGAHSNLETRVIVRPADQRGDGLGGAVVRGLRAVQSPWFCVMDGDLQHPPELIPQLLQRAEETGADIVLASRRVKTSRTNGLNIIRKTISRTLDAMARFMFPAHLRHVQDPLTGFFLARRQAIDIDRLRPRGFKILLEILVRFPGLRVTEIPFDFATRHAGKSKASASEVAKYLSLLLHLRFGDGYEEFVKFAVVGASGILVNSLALVVATDLMGIYYLISAALASVVSTIWNFMFTEYWVFGPRRPAEGMARRFGFFFVMNNAALALRGPVIYSLTTGLGVHYLASNWISLILMMVARYAVADGLIWAKDKPAKSDAVNNPLAVR